jgi:hypothetical protein
MVAPPRHRIEPKTGIDPFGRLVARVMSSERYASAGRVFWIVDNGFLSRWPRIDRAYSEAMADRPPDPPPGPRLLAEPDRAVLLHRATQGLTPNDLATLDALAERSIAFAGHYRHIVRPVQWTFTRQHLDCS